MEQLRIAETEKYAHVTFFFNGGVEKQYPGEDRILVKSPAVATYDLQPEMSAYEVTDKLVPAIKSGKYDMIILNFANCDMVGHTGVFEAVGTKAIGALGNVIAFAPWVAGVLAVSALAGVGIYKLYKAHQATKKFTQENIEWTKQMYGDVSMVGLDSSQQMNKYLKVLNDSQSSLNEKTENYIKLLKEL